MKDLTTKYGDTILDSNEEFGIKQVTTNNGRYYVTPNGDAYPSVTTVVGILNASKIEEWVASVGQEYADKIKKEAGEHGTRWHTLMEETILNGVQTLPFGREFFKVYPKLVREVLPRITDVVFAERRMYSDTLEVAGTADLVAKFDGSMAIVDWKTTRNYKGPKDCISYWCQLASYAVMVKEMYDIEVKKLVLVFNDDDTNVYVLETHKVSSWVENFKKVREKYKNKYGV